MNEKKITIQDIAATANVSKSTVSRVLNNSSPVNESKKQAVLTAMADLDFRPNIFARGLAGGKSMAIGILTQNIGSPFYDAVTQGIIREFSNSEYSPIFADGQWKPQVEKSAINSLLSRQIDGLILVGGDLELEFLNEVKQTIPTILAARELEQWNEQCIYIDNYQAAYDVTKYLIDLGHRDIAHITGIRDHQDAIRRFKGYADAMADAEIELNDDLIFEGNFSSQSGILAVEAFLMRGSSFTAIFAANDEMAYGVRLGLYRKGIRVPEDVSIVGFDNQPNSAYMTPPLTTVQQPATEIGQASARAMLQLLQGEPIEPPTLVTELIIRESATKRG